MKELLDKELKKVDKASLKEDLKTKKLKGIINKSHDDKDDK